MSLRGAVTGADSCTATGAGPSNAVAGLADTLLGTASKTRSQLHEYSQTAQPAPPQLPGVQCGQPLSIADAVNRLAGPSNAAVPMHPDALADPLLQAFEHAFISGQTGAPVAPPPLHAPFHGPPRHPVAPPPPPQVYQTLHHFLRTSLARHHFTPLQQPAPPTLPLPDQLRIRDRGTILARHLHADSGDAYADSQVASLLRGLGIEPTALPARLEPGLAGAPGGEWDHAWAAAVQHAPPEPPMAAANVADSIAGSHHPNWADDFARMSVHAPNDMQRAALEHQAASRAAAGAAWAADFENFGPSQAVHGTREAPGAAWADQFAGDSGGWADQFAGVASTGEGAIPGSAWAEEFSEQARAREGAVAGTSDSDAAKIHSQKLADVLRNDPQQKFQKSQFLQFVSKMSQGELEFQGGKLVDQPLGGAWADQFAAGNDTGAQGLGNLGEGWAEQFAAGGAPLGEAGWAEQFAQGIREQAGRGGNGNADAWVADFEGMQERTAEQEAFDHAWADFGQQHSASTAANSSNHPYQFHPNNPYDGNPDALALAQQAFKEGSLQDACLALEAVVKANPGDAQAWRLLGAAHAENDNDAQAIAAALRALDAAPSNAGVLLALGVSHVNELQEGEAVGYLLRWLRTQSMHVHALEGLPENLSTVSMEDARAAFRRAVESTPSDSDVHTALGVIAHLAGDYAQATTAFEEALRMRPEDYSLWNKLGATLANSGHSEAAKGAYAHALKHKPNYMRAWSNMGISYSNLGEYGAAAQYFLKSLILNRGAESVWGYLQTATVMLGSEEALQMVHARDVDGLVRLLGVATPGNPGDPEPGMGTATLAHPRMGAPGAPIVSSFPYKDIDGLNRGVGGPGQGLGVLGGVDERFVEGLSEAFAEGGMPELPPFGGEPGGFDPDAEVQVY